MKAIKVLIVDDSVWFRQGVCTMLSTQSDIASVVEARDGEEGILMAKHEKPDVILLDLSMPKLDGFGAIGGLREVSPDSKILIFTGYGEPDKVYRAIKAGALGYLLKDSTFEQIMQAIRAVADGQVSIDSSVAYKLIQEFDLVPAQAQTVPQKPAIIEKLGLTNREYEVLSLLAKGNSNKEIAEILVLQEHTIAKYVKQVLEKMQVKSRLKAAYLAWDGGLTNFDPKMAARK